MHAYDLETSFKARCWLDSIEELSVGDIGSQTAELSIYSKSWQISINKVHACVCE